MQGGSSKKKHIGAISTLRTSNDARGTPRYRAPELLTFDKPIYNNKVILQIDHASRPSAVYLLEEFSRNF